MESPHRESCLESRYHADHCRKARCVLTVSALLVVIAAQMAVGQSVIHPLNAPAATTTENSAYDSEVSLTSRPETIDFDALTENEWKRLRNDRLNNVRSRDDQVWTTAAADIIYLSCYFRDRVDFRRASLPLMHRYVFETDESLRLLALSAMHAIGHHDTMARLGQRIRVERSPKVKRLTTAAVNDYFKPARGAADEGERSCSSQTQ